LLGLSRLGLLEICFGLAKLAKPTKLKKIPRKRAVLAGCFEPGSTRWGPCWSFRRFVQDDATHRSKEGSPFFKCWLKNVLPITNTAGVLFFKIHYSLRNLFLIIFNAVERLPYALLNYPSSRQCWNRKRPANQPTSQGHQRPSDNTEESLCCLLSIRFTNCS
jgi:hypothetical protein